MNKLYKLSLLSCVIGLASCEAKDDKTDEPATATIIDAGVDLRAPDDAKLIKYATESEVLQELDFLKSSFLNDDLIGKMSLEEDDGCFLAALDKIIARVFGDTLIYQGEIDIKACMEESMNVPDSGLAIEEGQRLNLIEDEIDLGDTKTTVSEGKMKFSFSITCKGKDLSTLNGKKISEISHVDEHDDLCRGAYEVDLLQNTIFTFEMTSESNFGGAVYKIEQGSRNLEATMTQENAPCKWLLKDGVYTVENGCSETSKEINTKYRVNDKPSAEEGLTRYTRLTHQGVKKPDEKSSYMSGGYTEVIIGNWQGAVTFTAGDEPPTYSLSDGTTTSTGTINAKSLLHEPLSTPLQMVHRTILRALFESH